MVAWPSTLTIIKQDAKETPPKNMMRSNMDTGPAKVRRRTTSNVRLLNFTLFLTDDGVNTLDSFFVNDTKSGVLEFDFVHPRTQVTVQARFVTEPEYVPDETMYRCPISLEIMP